jgi:hypothetical protein
VKKHGVEPLVVPGIERSIVDDLEVSEPVTGLPLVREKAIEDAVSLERWEVMHTDIVVKPCTSPGSPATDMGVAREEVAIGAPLVSGVEVVSTDHLDPFLVAVSGKQLFAEIKESSFGQAVILEDDPLVNL